MTWLKTIFQVIIAIPSIIKLVLEIVKSVQQAVQSAKAQEKFETETRRNKEIENKLEKAESREEAQLALDEAAKAFGKKGGGRK